MGSTWIVCAVEDDDMCQNDVYDAKKVTVDYLPYNFGETLFILESSF